MLKTCHYISLMLLLLLCPSYAIANKPSSTTLFEATYKGKISGFNITMVRTLKKQADGSYVFSSSASNWLASFDEISAFVIGQDTIKPSSYLYKRSIARRKTTESIRYDWERLSAEYTRSNREDGHHAHPLTSNMLDPSLYQLFLQADTYLNKPTLEYTFIKRRRIEEYSFKRLPDEKVTLDKREHRALVLIREDQEKTKKTKVWILPELDHQIGKIQHTDKNGSTYHAYLSHYTSKPTALYAFYKSARTAKNSLQPTHPKLTDAPRL